MTKRTTTNQKPWVVYVTDSSGAKVPIATVPSEKKMVNLVHKLRDKYKVTARRLDNGKRKDRKE